MPRFRILSIPCLVACSFLHTGCLTMKSVKISSIDALRVELNGNVPNIRFDLRVENPNNWGVRLLEAETGLLIDNKPVGTAKADQRLKIRAKSETAVPVSIQTSYMELLKMAPQGLELLSGQRSVEGRAVGSLKIGKFIFRKRIAFDLSEKLDQQRLKKLFGK